MSKRDKKRIGRKHESSRIMAGPANCPAKPRKVAGLPVPIDGDPVRRAARKAHERIRVRMESIEKEIESFEGEDLAAYQRWLHSSFGPLLTELRDLDINISAKQDILDRVNDYQYWENISPARAYALVKHDMVNQDPDMNPEIAGQDRPGPDFDDFDDSSDEELRSVYEAASYMFESQTGFEAPDFESFKEALGMGGARPAGKDGMKESGQARVKKLYRTIARILHPDISDSFSVREQRLWHQAQEAYRQGDIIGLETVLAHLEAASSDPIFAPTVSELMDRTREMREMVQFLEEDLKEARLHPGWQFCRKNAVQIESLRKRLRKELERSLNQAKNCLADVEAELQKLENALSKMQSHKRKKDRKSRTYADGTGQARFTF
jgi:hypothetical protein